jgi:rare lipoprotein A
MSASYYGYSLEGNETASGEPFDPEGYTAAHRTLPLGTRLLVSYGGESVRVTVNDRGPYVAGRDLDLSLAAAREIGLTAPGSAPVRVSVL